MPRIGIDEKAIRKGHNCVISIDDLDRSTVEVISDGKDIEAGNAEIFQLSESQQERSDEA